MDPAAFSVFLNQILPLLSLPQPAADESSSPAQPGGNGRKRKMESIAHVSTPRAPIPRRLISLTIRDSGFFIFDQNLNSRTVRINYNGTEWTDEEFVSEINSLINISIETLWVDLKTTRSMSRSKSDAIHNLIIRSLLPDARVFVGTETSNNASEDYLESIWSCLAGAQRSLTVLNTPSGEGWAQAIKSLLSKKWKAISLNLTDNPATTIGYSGDVSSVVLNAMGRGLKDMTVFTPVLQMTAEGLGRIIHFVRCDHSITHFCVFVKVLGTDLVIQGVNKLINPNIDGVFIVPGVRGQRECTVAIAKVVAVAAPPPIDLIGADMVQYFPRVPVASDCVRVMIVL